MIYTLTINTTPIKTGTIWDCLAWLKDSFGNVTLTQALSAGVKIEVVK